MALEPLRTTQARLEAAGFVGDLVAFEGLLHVAGSETYYEPSEVRVVETARFEGSTDPDDEAILMAIATVDGTPIGLYVTPYGVDMSAEDAAVVQHLRDA
ncbi:hypothetical protein BH10ACT3_BH10ACT3_01020 [soil metagenome]